ncbi:hypothetical protein AVEN_65453-1 [Araneus ventricosus]|uniref:Uncharacterized protein n=1 Tax=Araneus ventricosus TaxID=182803 RepID=A0A4Y2II88_ARAVE|nr:hypothetical protein AVEN_65453-1 [Araneus ventricosus]
MKRNALPAPSLGSSREEWKLRKCRAGVGRLHLPLSNGDRAHKQVGKKVDHGNILFSRFFRDRPLPTLLPEGRCPPPLHERSVSGPDTHRPQTLL